MRKGSHHTKQAKERIRLSHIGKSSGMLGKYHSEESKQKMSLSTAGNKNPMKRPEVKTKFMGKNNVSKRLEVRKKISDSKKGKKNYNWIEREIRKCACGCGETFECKINSKRRFINYHSQRKNPSTLGKHWVKKRREQWSETMSGKGNPNWQGGIGKLGYSFDFNEELKELIRKRDDYTCQLCDKKQHNRKLSVHHIDYIKENLDPSNLITLCRACNIKVNYGRKLWKKFFQQKLRLLA